MRKLRSYCRERIAQLKEEEKTQKELRIYCRYSRLPKLPTEIIVRILSTLESGTGSTLNTQIPKAISVEACGLLQTLQARKDTWKVVHCFSEFTMILLGEESAACTHIGQVKFLDATKETAVVYS